MDHTIALIRRAHEGDENARAQLVEENTGLDLVRGEKILRTGAQRQRIYFRSEASGF